MSLKKGRAFRYNLFAEKAKRISTAIPHAVLGAARKLRDLPSFKNLAGLRRSPKGEGLSRQQVAGDRICSENTFCIFSKIDTQGKKCNKLLNQRNLR